MDRAANVPVGSAAADVAAHGLVDIGVGWLRFLREQRGRAHDLPGLAVAALRNIVFDPGHLHGMAAIGRESFDGGDGLAGHALDLRDAGAHGVSVDVDGASSAHGHAAAELGARHAERVAEDPQQRHFRDRIYGLRFPV